MSDQDPPHDPFASFEADRTVIKPSAGRGARAAPAAVPASTPRAPEVPLPDLPAHASLNPLVQAAAPLLSAAPRIRATVRHSDPAGLRANLVESIKRFEAVARGRGLPNDQVVAARYVLCTLIDESASSTPWGGSGAWSSQSLLVHFHNEAWGGEKVFQLLQRLAEQPQQQRNLLELIYVVLTLGFEGRYRVADNGRAQLDALRERLAAKLRELAGAADRELSPQWQGVAAAPVRLSDGVPVWVVGAALAGLLLALFLLLRLTLNAQTDATFTALQALDARAAPVAAAPPPPVAPAAPPPPRLAGLLKADIDAGAVEVRDLADRSIVTLRGDGVFDAGSSDVSARVRPLLLRIGAALGQVQGPVLIAGHTDNQPIRSLRYPSNWHLSRDRAASVKALLGGSVKPERLTAEGHADTEPLADNGSAEGRARNRRVEITLLAAAPN
ncbi:Outer membrane protein ImpK/VasF, OmpA/MotB domain [Rubrivivax sp. A210]|uniref:DotU family type VI secretion system protein n=1 Tax=Rubrivivax sp. A210 TaxID=2772301 RepID=UPI00191B10BA|nr:DotU family type VI secretion system protein [Rubrivivax sp. A210]CAD5369288.1 Outer membrane protein ImpK/VasF, OmpA/MotB domain [Rubrivivax sp. A210]